MASIKEIAKLTGVSIATVSKIVNNKADDISQETIDRVLKVVKQYNYTPYGLSRKDTNTKTLTIGLLLKKMYNTNLMINSLVERLSKSGYTLMLFDSDESIENERMNLSKIASKNLDGLIWEPVSTNSLENINILKNNHTKVIYIDYSGELENSFYIDYQKMSYVATQTLIDKGHSRIGIVVNKGSNRSEQAIIGFKQCLFDNGILFDQDMVIPFDNFKSENFKAKNFTAIISSHFAITQKLYTQLELMNISLPTELSLISLRDDVREGIDITNISTIKIPNYEFGSFLGNRIVSMCESKEIDDDNIFDFEPVIENFKTIDIPYDMRSPKITIVGSINVDNIFYLDEFPYEGSTSIATESLLLPGGKGLNQAVGVANLGKDVTLIGKIGKDNEGSYLCKMLNDNGIETHDIIASSKVHTGKAFIAINHAGQSIITVTKGANNSISKNEITNKSKCFENTGVCLLQTEISSEAIYEAARLAKIHNAITILKPATVHEIDDELYRNIDFFIPNRKEALRLSKKETIEEAAEYFISLGLKNVIITLDKDGALLKTKDKHIHFEAQDTKVIDTTGGSDAFISTFAVKLLEGYSVENSIKAGIIAASYCISKFGVSNSMIDEITLNRCLLQEGITK